MNLSPIYPLSELPNNPALHIPDGFLSLAVSIIFWLISISLLTIAVRRTDGNLGERQIPLMGIMAAFIFAGQMINFPVLGGTSGHLLGGVLAAIVLGPWAGMLVMASVVGLQALLFQDGGLVVMGANIFNMGLLTTMIGYGCYRAVVGRSKKTRLVVAGIAAWLSVMGGALLTALQLWLSGTSPLTIVLPAMLGVHAVIGIGETLITIAALSFIMQSKPDLLAESEVKAKGGQAWIIVGGVITLAIVLISPWASSNPDGLERVAEDIGFIVQGQTASYQLLTDYQIPILGDAVSSTIMAGLIGIIAVAILSISVGWLRKRGRIMVNN